MFGRSKPRDEFSDESADLRRSVQTRGKADIPGASAYVDSYVRGVALAASTFNSRAADRRLRDRLRMFLVVGLPSWFHVIDRLPEAQDLKNEWRSLCFDAQHFGPEHLIAWWWLLSGSLFRPLVDNQLEQMRGPLTDGARQIERSSGAYTQDMVDWEHFFE